MEATEDTYENHRIIVHTTGPTEGPWLASYSITPLDSDDPAESYIDGKLPIAFVSQHEAIVAGLGEAQIRIDALPTHLKPSK